MSVSACPSVRPGRSGVVHAVCGHAQATEIMTLSLVLGGQAMRKEGLDGFLPTKSAWDLSGVWDLMCCIQRRFQVLSENLNTRLST